ncbi:MAG: hypothetical protein ACRELS_13430 [Candidatus Rokuibacteriota bacterium]
MTQAELLRYLVDALEALGIEYMITGSQASIYYGEPRFTQDIDVVAEVEPAHVSALMMRFALPEFYLSEESARAAMAGRGQFNIVHPESGLKVDVVLRKDTPFAHMEFGRRQRQPIVAGRQAYFARPEDVILHKLVFVRRGASERHLRDIAGILRVSGPEIDIAYVTEWAERLGVLDLWTSVRQRTSGC